MSVEQQLAFDFQSSPPKKICAQCEKVKLNWPAKGGRICVDCANYRRRLTYKNNKQLRERTKRRCRDNKRKQQKTTEGRERLLAAKARERAKPGYSQKRRYESEKYRHTDNRIKITAEHCERLKRRISKRLNRGRLSITKAWKDWFCCEATDAWLDLYYAGESWWYLDPRVQHTSDEIRKIHNERSANRYRQRYQNNPGFNVQERLRNTLAKCLKSAGRNYSRTFGSIPELKRGIEEKFTNGMTWEAYMNGDIHIDHIMPKVYFDHTNDDEVRHCWAIENLQPLWDKANRKKHDSVDPKEVCPDLWAAYGYRVPENRIRNKDLWL